MSADREIAALRREERFKEAGNAAADLVIYDIMANWPPPRALRDELAMRIFRAYGDVIRYDQAAGIVGAVIVQEMQKRELAERLRAAEKLKPRRRRMAA